MWFLNLQGRAHVVNALKAHCYVCQNRFVWVETRCHGAKARRHGEDLAFEMPWKSDVECEFALAGADVESLQALLDAHRGCSRST